MMLEYRNITKKFGNKEAVKELTLKLKKGTIYGLLGENGSGKTTLMKMAAGLTQPTEGEILFEGHPLSYQDKASIAYMSTEPFFYSYMKVKDVEEYYADFFEDFDREQFRKTIERLGLNEEVESFIEDAIFIKDGQLVDVVNVETERMTTGNSLAELYLQKM